jgi:HAD superfamily hydrolase (TIGR01509 family)
MSLPNFDLVIFDCDGVLIDSEVVSARADAKALQTLGIDISAEDLARRFAGVSYAKIDAEIQAEYGITFPEGFRERVRQVVLGMYQTELAVIDGAFAVLSALKVQKCVASSAAPAKLATGLIVTRLYELVYPHVYSAALVAKGKPEPDIFLYAARQFGVSADRCIVVEDSVAGVTAAKAAGMKCMGFTGASHCYDGHGQRLRDTGADWVTGDLADVLGLVG